MDFGTPAKAPTIGSAAPPPRADIVATRGSISVELPPEKTVQSARAGDAVKLDVRAQDRDADTDAPERQQVAAKLQSEPNLRDVIQRRLLIEPETRTIVLRKTNTQTGETTELVPDEATLKLRLYNRQLAERARAASEISSRYIERSA